MESKYPDIYVVISISLTEYSKPMNQQSGHVCVKPAFYFPYERQHQGLGIRYNNLDLVFFHDIS